MSIPKGSYDGVLHLEFATCVSPFRLRIGTDPVCKTLRFLDF
jgi:hypothetical protein